MASLIFISHVIICVWLNETFIRYLYGYEYDPKILKTQFRHSKCLAVITLSFLVLDEIYLFTQDIQLYWISIFILSILSIGYIILLNYRHKKNDTICTILVKGQNLKSTTRSDLVNGKSDIVINFKHGSSNKYKHTTINIFTDNIHIVENENILIISKTGKRLLSKDEVENIKINNHRGVDITVRYDDITSKWKQV